jgi:hypothetical protein
MKQHTLYSNLFYLLQTEPKCALPYLTTSQPSQVSRSPRLPRRPQVDGGIHGDAAPHALR